MAHFKKIAFVASPTGHAREAAAALMRRYDHVPPEEADVVVALGGDGLMLQVLHRFMDNPKPIYGMNRGTVGFLMNEFRDDDLLEHLEKAHRSVIHPLVMDGSTPRAAPTGRGRSTRSTSCARPTRRPSSRSPWTGTCAWIS